MSSAGSLAMVAAERQHCHPKVLKRAANSGRFYAMCNAAADVSGSVDAAPPSAWLPRTFAVHLITRDCRSGASGRRSGSWTMPASMHWTP